MGHCDCDGKRYLRFYVPRRCWSWLKDAERREGDPARAAARGFPRIAEFRNDAELEGMIGGDPWWPVPAELIEMEFMQRRSADDRPWFAIEADGRTSGAVGCSISTGLRARARSVSASVIPTTGAAAMGAMPSARCSIMPSASGNSGASGSPSTPATSAPSAATAPAGSSRKGRLRGMLGQRPVRGSGADGPAARGVA